MARLIKALSVLVLFAAWIVPAQFAIASTLHSKSPVNVHQEDEVESESEDEDDPESEDHEDHESESGKQFAPPPLVVKHKPHTSSLGTGTSISGTNAGISGQGAVLLTPDFTGQEFVTSPVGPTTLHDGRELPRGQAVNPTENEPLAKLMGFANYEDPAAEFMHKAYFGLGVLGVGAVAMASHTLTKARRLAKANESDYDYEGQD